MITKQIDLPENSIALVFSAENERIMLNGYNNFPVTEDREALEISGRLASLAQGIVSEVKEDITHFMERGFDELRTQGLLVEIPDQVETPDTSEVKSEDKELNEGKTEQLDLTKMIPRGRA